jgi:hypothetical protein
MTRRGRRAPTLSLDGLARFFVTVLDTTAQEAPAGHQRRRRATEPPFI